MRKVFDKSLVRLAVVALIGLIGTLYAADVIIQDGDVTGGNVTSGANPGHTHTQSSLVPKGMIHMAYVEYNDSDTIDVTVGYGECNGSYWEITSTTSHDMTSLASGEDWHYIYIDDSASSYPTPTIIDSTTEPAWSDSKLGYYNGDDRCIGVVWSSSGSATLDQFMSNSNGRYCVDDILKQVLDDGNPTNSWQTVEATAYIPVNAIAVYVQGQNFDVGPDSVRVEVSAYESGCPRAYNRSYYGACEFEWVDLERGSSRDLRYKGEDNDDNTFDVYIHGYQIER